MRLYIAWLPLSRLIFRPYFDGDFWRLQAFVFAEVKETVKILNFCQRVCLLVVPALPFVLCSGSPVLLWRCLAAVVMES